MSSRAGFQSVHHTCRQAQLLILNQVEQDTLYHYLLEHELSENLGSVLWMIMHAGYARRSTFRYGPNDIALKEDA